MGKSRKKKVSRPIPKTGEDIKRETALKNNLFSRYLLFRYSLALFFFANLYWILTQLLSPQLNLYILLPIGLLLILVSASAEQLRLYGAKEEKVQLGKTALAMKAQAVSHILLGAVVLLPDQLTSAIPYFSNHPAARTLVGGLQIAGLLICLFNLSRIRQVEQNKDKFYYRFQNQIKKYI